MGKVLKFMSPLATLLKSCKHIHKGGRVGLCIVCKRPLKLHFNEKNAFIGCPKKESK
jgi:hypothetical protein